MQIILALFDASSFPPLYIGDALHLDESGFDGHAVGLTSHTHLCVLVKGDTGERSRGRWLFADTFDVFILPRYRIVQEQ